MKLFPIGKLLIAPLFVSVLMTLPAPAAEKASAVIENFNDALLKTMQQAKTLGYAGRYAKLAPAVRSAYDLEFWARYSAGRYWRSMSEQQRKRYTDAFSRLVIATYADRFDGYSGEKFHVLNEEPMRRNTILVRTELEKSDGERIKLNYLMRQIEAGWRVIDVFAKGTISELSTKRSEYSSTLKQKGYDGLIAAIEQKITTLAAKSG